MQTAKIINERKPFDWNYDAPIGFSHDTSVNSAARAISYYTKDPHHYSIVFAGGGVSIDRDNNPQHTYEAASGRPFSGRIGVLNSKGAATPNYFHWMVDCLSRVDLLGDLAEYTAIVLPAVTKSFQELTLRELQLDCPLVHASQGDTIRAEEIVIPTARRPTHFQVASWMVEFLRAAFLPIAAPIETPRRVFISRGQRGLRTLLNEGDVVQELKARGFETVFLENMSLSAQVATLCNAEAVVAPHGAGLTNAAFCNPGTKVIEIFSPHYLGGLFFSLSRHAGCEYRFILGSPSEFDCALNKNSQDILVDPAVLRECLNHAGL